MHFHHLEEFLLDAKNVEQDINIIRDGQKFYMGEVGKLPRGEGVITHAELARGFGRLPFPKCAFEVSRLWGVDPEVGAPDILLCEEMEVHGDQCTFVVCWTNVGRISPEWKNIGWTSFGALMLDRSTPDSTYYIPPLNLDDQGFQMGIERAGSMAITAKKVVDVLNCVNVRTEVVNAPSALNKKRSKQGKPPLYSYHVLVLRPSAAQRVDRGGAHESPRIHLRRGHIKHRRTGDFWWQPHVVGDRSLGVVMKDYRADKLLEA